MVAILNKMSGFQKGIFQMIGLKYSYTPDNLKTKHSK